MPFPIAILGVAVAGKAALTSWAVVRWRERPFARIRRAVADLRPAQVTLLRPWPEQELYRVVMDGRAYFDADDLRFGIQIEPGHQGRVALSVIWVEEKWQKSGSLASGVNPALEAALGRAYLDASLTRLTAEDDFTVAKNNIPS